MKILIAEDEAGITEILELVLKTDGHQLSKAKDCADRLRKYDEEKMRLLGTESHFDRVIVDWIMPRKG